MKTSLSLEADWNVDKKFPVVYELWNSILRFPRILTQMIENKMKDTNLSVAVSYSQIQKLIHRKYLFID